MKNIITLSLISASLLISGNPIHDLMDNRIKGQSYSGSLDDNVAAEDGLGILPLSSYSMPQDQANELLVQKILSDIERTETDKTKTVNIKDGLTAGTVGTATHLTLFNKYISASSGGGYTPNGEVDSTISNSGRSFGSSGTTEYAFNDIISDDASRASNSWLVDIGAPVYIGYNFPSAKVISRVMIAGGYASGYVNAAPQDFKVQASNDGSSWTDLGTFKQDNWGTYGTYKTFDFVNSTPYTYYRLYITSNLTGTGVAGTWYAQTAIADMKFVEGIAPVSVVTSGTSCKSIKTASPSATDGVYTINGVQAYCDMTTDGGGWTLISHISSSELGQSIVAGTNISTLTNPSNPTNVSAFMSQSTMNSLGGSSIMVKKKDGYINYAISNTGNPIPDIWNYYFRVNYQTSNKTTVNSWLSSNMGQGMQVWPGSNAHWGWSGTSSNHLLFGVGNNSSYPGICINSASGMSCWSNTGGSVYTR